MGMKSIIMVFAFNVVFMTLGFNLSHMASSAYRKYIDYYKVEQAQYVVASAANIAVSNVYVGGTNSSDETDFTGGNFKIDQTAFEDTLIQLNVEGNFQGISGTNLIFLARPSFSTYAMYSEKENGIYWVTGDTCRGPLHTQDYLYIYGDPVFEGRVTTKLGLSKYHSYDDPKFLGGYEEGVEQTMPLVFTDVINYGINGGRRYNTNNVWIDFFANGKILVREGPGSTPPAMSTATPYNNINELTSTGVVLVEGKEVHIKGKLNGKVTIGAVGANSKVWIDSSITYSENPQNPDRSINKDCHDMLGIVSDNDISVAIGAEDNGPVNPKGVTIHATMISRLGGFGADQYSTRAIGGKLTVIGGIQQKDRKAVGTAVSGVINHGFQKKYDFDKRLEYESPRGYPLVTQFRVRNWNERMRIPNMVWMEGDTI